ncbi:MAG: DUF481 domain-containing protein [Chitinophagaceae bacterium]
MRKVSFPVRKGMVSAYLLLLFMLIGFVSFGQEKDSVFLYNGQILIGDIKVIQLGVLTIDDVDLNDENVKLYKIKRLKSVQRYKIEAGDKEIYYGMLRASDKSGWIDIVCDDGELVHLDLVSLHLVVPLEKSFLDGLTGSISAGFSYTKSSSVGQFNLSSTINYNTRRWEFQFSGSENASIDTSKFSRDREDFGLMVGYYLSNTWFLAGGCTYQRNLELSIARRFQQTLGAGNKFLVTNSSQLLGISGLAINQEHSTSGDDSKLLYEIPLLFRFNYYHFKHPNIQINSSQSAYIGLSQWGRVRYEGNTVVLWELVSDFNVSVNPYTNFDSRPPDGSSNFDYGVVFSLTYKF